MSLEAAITALTAAVEANTAALAGGEAKAPAKPAAKPAAKAAAAKKPAAKKGPTADDVISAFGEFLKTGDKDERESAKAAAKAIITHFSVDRISNLEASDYEEALALLEQYKAGEDPFGGGEEEEDGDLM